MCVFLMFLSSTAEIMMIKLNVHMCKLKHSKCQIKILILNICICLFLKHRLVQSGSSVNVYKLTLHSCLIVEHIIKLCEFFCSYNRLLSLLWADIAQDYGDWVPGFAPKWSPTLMLGNKTWLVVVRFLPKVVEDLCRPVSFFQTKPRKPSSSYPSWRFLAKKSISPYSVWKCSSAELWLAFSLLLVKDK